MKTVGKVTLYFLLAVCTLWLSGCGKKADENKPISEVKAEAENMAVKDLRAMAAAYRDAIQAKTAEANKLIKKIGEIPLTEKLGAEAKALTADLDNLNKSVSALKERFGVYYNKLKEKGGDLTGLEI
ncbi:MAG TPA: hypothetical protein VMW16_16370 [Sedimentisphaerales bacterium]|nr:hypothetical protein [Sedimentisphaerales bacterium]